MSSDLKWWAGEDGEYYTIGPCDTREQVIEEAKSNDLGLRQDEQGHWSRLTFQIVEAAQRPVEISHHFSIDDVVQGICENIDEEYGFDGNEYPSDDAWTTEQELELETSLRAAISEWQKRHDIVIIPTSFTHQRNQETVDVRVPLPIN